MAKIDKLWQLYKSKDDPRAREQIILAYAPLAKHVVDRMPVRPSAVVGHDDLLSHAIVGLIDAVEKFDPSRQVKFETYAVSRIRGAILDAIKSLDWAPRSVRASEQQIRRAFADMEAQLGRPAQDEEVASSLGISVDELHDALADAARSAVLSLEDFMLFGEYMSDGSLSTSADGLSSPALAAEAEERKRILAKAMEGLPEKEKLVTSLYYKEGLTLKEIAKVLGVTESRACQLHSKAIIRLQGKLARHADLLLAAA
jgi:RNA polymerase sigma factor for flagellar operon FliA